VELLLTFILIEQFKQI